MREDLEALYSIAGEDGMAALLEIDGAADALRADLYRRSMDWFSARGKAGAKARRACERALKGMVR